MTNHILTKEKFLDDLKDHKLTVLLDDGVHRHLHCSKGASHQHFDVVTYPGYLVISGDMGTFVFSRLTDMFNFFSGNKEERINAGYWEEKLEAVSKTGGPKRFQQNKVFEIVNIYLDDFCENCLEEHYMDSYNEKYESLQIFSRKLREEVEHYFKQCDLSNEYEAGSAFDDFESEICEEFNFEEWYEYSFKDYSFHYIWCCYAIIWAISEYKKVESLKTTDK